MHKINIHPHSGRITVSGIALPDIGYAQARLLVDLLAKQLLLTTHKWVRGSNKAR